MFYKIYFEILNFYKRPIYCILKFAIYILNMLLCIKLVSEVNYVIFNKG